MKESESNLEFIDTKACASMLSLGEDVIRKYVRNRSIPHYKFQGNVRFLKSEILKWIQDGKRE